MLLLRMMRHHQILFSIFSTIAQPLLIASFWACLFWFLTVLRRQYCAHGLYWQSAAYALWDSFFSRAFALDS
jgi:hypothetical protein